MQLLFPIVHLGQAADTVHNAVADYQIDTNADLVTGQYLLSGDVHLTQAGVHNVYIYIDAIVPEIVSTRLQHSFKLFVEEQACLGILGYFHLLCADLEVVQNADWDRGGNPRAGDIFDEEGMLAVRIPKRVFARRQHAMELTVDKMQAKMHILHFDSSSLRCNLRVGQQRIQRSLETLQVKLDVCNFDFAVAKGVVFACVQQFFEAAVFEQKALLICENNGLFHGSSSFFGMHKRYMNHTTNNIETLSLRCSTAAGSLSGTAVQAEPPARPVVGAAVSTTGQGGTALQRECVCTPPRCGGKACDLRCE